MTDSKKKKWQANSLGLVSMVSIPLQGKEEKVIGVLNCFTKQPYEFSETDINMLSAIATQAAIVIHNTELIKKTKIIEQELQIRKRIEEGKRFLWIDAG